MTPNLLSRPLSDSQFQAGTELQGTNLLKDINILDYIKIRLSPSSRQHALFIRALEPCRRQSHICDLHVPKVYVTLARAQRKRGGTLSAFGLTVLSGGDSGSPAEPHRRQSTDSPKAPGASASREKGQRGFKKNDTTKREIVPSESDAEEKQ